MERFDLSGQKKRGVFIVGIAVAMVLAVALPERAWISVTGTGRPFGVPLAVTGLIGWSYGWFLIVFARDETHDRRDGVVISSLAVLLGVLPVMSAIAEKA